MTQEQMDALRVVAAMPREDRLRELHLAEQRMLHQAEQEKPHALRDRGQLLPDAEFNALVDDLMDGGGVTDLDAPVEDGQSVVALWLQAMHDRDQAAFWPRLRAVKKALLVVLGHKEIFAGGGRRTAGASKSIKDAIREMTEKAARDRAAGKGVRE